MEEELAKPQSSTFRASLHHDGKLDEPKVKVEKSTTAKEEDRQWTMHNQDGNVIFKTINVTSAHRNRCQMMRGLTHVCMFQEHGLNEAVARAAEVEMAGMKWNMKCGPVDPEHIRPSAGVGIMMREPMKPIKLLGKTPA